MAKDIISRVEDSIKRNWDRDALTDYRGCTLQYKDVARRIEKLHIMFDEVGLVPGDKISLCGRNSSNWGVAFLAALTYGAVPVPILHEFKADNIHNIINHSDSRLAFISESIWENLNEEEIPHVLGVVQLEDYDLLISRSEKLVYAREHLNELFGKKFPNRFEKNMVNFYHANEPDDLAIINYTSGSTGFSKGVMIPHRAVANNMEFADRALNLKAGSTIVSMLPMAHMYGMAFEFLYELTIGMHIYFLTRIPSPKIIFQALNEIKPTVIVAVPLIIEKIIKKNVLPQLEKPGTKFLLKVPIVNEAIRTAVREKMITSFGGNFYEVIVGGAAFNQEVETLLHQLKFPYTVGYGATECAPIICYEDWKKFVPGSCGKAAYGMTVRVDSKDPERVAGEILVKGPNVMLGYYKNEEATAETIDADGWYHTGDLGVMDKDGNVFIKGRSKNMLLGPSGQNIYPEEIEDQLNSLPYVSESLIVHRDGKLVALIHPDYDTAFKEDKTVQDVAAQMDANRIELNKNLPAYCQVSSVQIHSEEFEKTPKKSIKRFLYQ
ncbi:MAG: AMP-binding protein [Bacteroidaceae bacterium]|nr:AMP-binding protein [Bacteroidaceae bacterium]